MQLQKLAIACYKGLSKEKKQAIDITINPELASAEADTELSNADRIASVKAFIYEAYDGAFLRRKRSILKRTWRSFVRENVDEFLKIPESDSCYLESRKTIVAVVDLLEYGRNYYVFSFTGSDPVEQSW